MKKGSLAFAYVLAFASAQCNKPFQEQNARNECVCMEPFEADMSSGSLKCQLKGSIDTTTQRAADYTLGTIALTGADIAMTYVDGQTVKRTNISTLVRDLEAAQDVSTKADATTLDAVNQTLTTKLATTQGNIIDINSRLSEIDTKANAAELQVLNNSFMAFTNASTVNLISLDQRIAIMTDDLVALNQVANIVQHGDFSVFPLPQENTGRSTGNYERVNGSDTSMPEGYQFALKFTPNQLNSEYELIFTADDLPDAMCPGTFVLSAWAKYSADYDGDERVLHSRMWYVDGSTQAFNPVGAASGGWPTKANDWQRVQLAFTTRDLQLDYFRWFLGYPIRSTQGAVWVTGLDLRRIGPGTCNLLNDKHQRLTDRVDELEAKTALDNNNTINSIQGIDARLAFAESEIERLSDTPRYELIRNGNMVNGTAPLDLKPTASLGNAQIVPIPDTMRIPNSNLTHAFEFTAANGASQEQEIHSDPDASLCGGEYVISGWLRYSSDYDGHQQALHTRFGLTQTVFATGAASGGWPTAPDQWQYISIGAHVPTKFDWLRLYVGWPTRGTKGKWWATGLSVARLGGRVFCTNRRRSIKHDDADWAEPSESFADWAEPSESFESFELKVLEAKYDDLQAQLMQQRQEIDELRRMLLSQKQ